MSGRLIAFPVELNSTISTNAIQQLEDVLSNTDLSTSELAVEVNRVVIKNNLSTSFMVDNISVQDANKITSIRQELQAKTEDIDLDMFTSNFDKYNVSTVVDFNNQPFSASKLVIDFNIAPPKTTSSKPKAKTEKTKKVQEQQTTESAPEVIVEASEVKKSKKKDPAAPVPVQKTTVQEVVTAKIKEKKPKVEPKPVEEKTLTKTSDIRVGNVYKQFYKGKYSNIIRITGVTENLVTYELENGQESSVGKNYLLKSETRLERHDGDFKYNNGVVVVRGVLTSNGQTVRGVQMNDGTVKLEVGRLPNTAFESLEILNLELNDPDLTKEAEDSINNCG